MGMRFHCVYNCRFLSNSASYAALEDSFRLGISTIHYIIKEVCEALHMPVPTTEMLLATSKEFYLRWNFPNCVGSIDGKHIRLSVHQIQAACTTTTSITTLQGHRKRWTGFETAIT